MASDGVPCITGECPPDWTCTASGSCLPPGSEECGQGYCASTDVCVDGQGCLPPGGTPCGAGYCPTDQICVDGQCEHACAPGAIWCEVRCVDPTSDPDHCGACDVTCIAGQRCSDGACTCPDRTAACDDACVDLLNDPDNCGACGTKCAAGAACRSGQCRSTGCTEFILSGGPSPLETIGVDDDLTISLNGTPIFVNADGIATELAPLSFTAQNGDTLRVIAIDVDPYCRGVDPLYLHCATTGAMQVLDADGQQDGCEFPISRPANFVFYDQTFTIAMP
jgi:hypothetical protein